MGSAELKVRMTRPSAVKKKETRGNQIGFPHQSGILPEHRD
jgi:hypothetical protein